MSRTRMLDQVPQFGWTRNTMINNETLSEPGTPAMNPAISTIVDRPNGALRVGLSGRTVLGTVSGTGTFGFILEGSNTGGTTIALSLNTVAGTFVAGETVTAPSGATATVTTVSTESSVANQQFVLMVDSWNEIDFTAVELITGGTSGATGILTEAVSEWVELGRTNFGELFDTSVPGVQLRVLGLSDGTTSSVGFIGEGTISCGRWSKLRVRTFIDTETVALNFDIEIRLSAISGDGEAREGSVTMSRTSGAITEPFTARMIRPEGTRFISAQMFVDSMINVATLPATEADGFVFELQGALDLAAAEQSEYSVLDTLGPFQVAGQSRHFSNGQIRLIDLGSFNYFRVQARKATGGTALSDDLSSYSARALINFDSNDWVDGEKGISYMPEALKEMFLLVYLSAPVLIAGTIWELRLQITNISLQPIRNTRPIGLLLADTQLGSFQDLTAGASFSSISKGSFKFGTGTNVSVVETDSDGEAIFRVDTGGSAPFVYAWNSIPRPPETNLANFGPGQFIIATDRAQLV